MQSHVVDYQVYGDDLQFVEVELDPGETVIAEAGAMMYMEDGLTFETKMGDGSKPSAGFLDKLVRCRQAGHHPRIPLYDPLYPLGPGQDVTSPLAHPIPARSSLSTWMKQTAS